ncbi:hypothetical protein JB92DRAFT_2829220 [Gautieria morchelliformis]|nr:hypothetical protein JB92DRAFT_2829220 [Gautieria morchelliformis]
MARHDLHDGLRDYYFRVENVWTCIYPSAGIDTAGAGYNGFPARTCRHGFSCARGSRRSAGLVLISPWAAKGAIEHEGQNAASTHTSVRSWGTRLRVPHFGRDEGHAADASWAGELLRRGGCIQFLWLDWDGEKRLQNVLVLYLATVGQQLVQRTGGWHGNVVAPRRALRPRALR